MEWTWSEEKNRTNRRDHGLSFETARFVFDDPLAMSLPDPHPDGDRWQTVGLVGTVALVRRAHLAGAGPSDRRSGGTDHQRPQGDIA